MYKLYFTLFILFLSLQSKAQQNVSELSNLFFEAGLSDIWGYIDSTGIEYALVAVKGSDIESGGLSVVSLSDSEFPVEVYFAQGSTSIWRDIKTYNGYAYVTTEAEEEGLMILNLNSLPETSQISVYSYIDDLWATAHNLYIDENGVMYIFGAGNDSLSIDGVLMYDLNDNPLVPEFLGDYNASYVHDGMAKGDTLYVANIFEGTFSILDVSDKSNPIYLGGSETPNSYTHNIWVSDDGDYVYTTDELAGAYIGAYDISDINDVEEADRINFDPGSNTTPHNVHFMDDYIITSYYKAGITIHDVSDPENIIQTGHYDTSPLSGAGFNGAWGVYPYLPSGNIVVSDVSEGLFVLAPNYTRASRLEGLITDSENSFPIFNASVEIIESEFYSIDGSNVLGQYKTGIAESGFFDVLVTKYGYLDVLVTDVEFTNGEVVELDISMQTDLSISIEEVEWNDVEIFPNPIKDQFYIRINEDYVIESIQLLISDLSGKEVYSEQIVRSFSSIQVNKLEKGVYILSLYNCNRALYKTKIFILK